MAALEDCSNHSGAELIADYRRLWQYSNELTANEGVGIDADDNGNPVEVYLSGYAYVKDLAEQGLYWVGNGNREQLFQVQFSNIATYNGTIQMGFVNQTALYLGLRCDADADNKDNGGPETFPYGVGWGQAVFNMNSVKEWSDSDPRKMATVLDCEKELTHFAYTTSCTEET